MEKNGSGGVSRPPWERRSLRKKRPEKQRKPPADDSAISGGNLNQVTGALSFRAAKHI
jgi:hypothetical protein